MLTNNAAEVSCRLALIYRNRIFFEKATVTETDEFPVFKELEISHSAIDPVLNRINVASSFPKIHFHIILCLELYIHSAIYLHDLVLRLLLFYLLLLLMW
jgi:hypothetical protein